MSPPLLRACSLGDSEHTDLPLPAPSSSLRRQSPQCARSTCSGGNCGRRSRSLPDLAGHLTARADGGHALPLGSSGKVFNLSFILPSLLVRFSALSWIKPHAAPLVVLPRQFLKVSVLRPYFPGGEQHLHFDAAHPRGMGDTLLTAFTARTTRVSNPVRSPGFRPSPSDPFQSDAFAIGGLPWIIPFYQSPRHTSDSSRSRDSQSPLHAVTLSATISQRI